MQDQLLKAGLTTSKKVKKQKQAKHQKTKKQKKSDAAEISESALLAQKADAEKRGRDRILNKEKEDAAKQKAISAQIKQLIQTNSANLNEGELTYNFEDEKIIRKVYVTEKLHKQISNGKYAIVKFEGVYNAVPLVVAQKIQDRDPSYLIVLNDAIATDDIDEEYADYQIPDDLMW